MSATFERELDAAIRVAREAGALLKDNFGKSQEVEYKGRIDLVTEMDRRSEELIIGRLRAAFPGDGFWAEERGRDSSGSDRVWIIDPLDGTVNYAHEYPVFSASIALQVAGKLVVGAVYNPLLDDMYAARQGGGAMLNGKQRRVTEVDTLERAFLATGFGYDVSTERDPEKNNLAPFSRFIVRAQAVRRAGSAALAIAKVGVGRTDGFWEGRLHPWDMAAAMVVVKEGGGMLTNYAGGPPALEGRQLVGSNGQIHEQMQQVLSAGVGSSSESHPAVTTATLNAFLAAFNAHDLDRIMDFLADDCEFHMPRGREPWGTRYVGKPAVREGLATRFTGIPDVHYGEDSHWVAENHGVSTWLLTGTTKTGEQVRVRGVDLLEFRDGKIIKKDAYWKIVEK